MPSNRSSKVSSPGTAVAESSSLNATTPLLQQRRNPSPTRETLLPISAHTSSESLIDNDDCDSHIEPHFESAEVVRDIVIGLSDGLTVPFALAAGLATLNTSHLVVTAGLAEIVAGAISMGLGGFLAGLSEIEHYDAERKREMYEVETMPEREEEEIVEIFEPYGMTRKDLEPMISKLKSNPDQWINFMMKFELSLERPSHHRSWISALTIGFSYLFGGLIPLIPYMLIQDTMFALTISSVATILALFIFGFVKAKIFGTPRPFFSALQMAIVGGAAAACAFGIAKLVPQPSL